MILDNSSWYYPLQNQQFSSYIYVIIYLSDYNFLQHVEIARLDSGTRTNSAYSKRQTDGKCDDPTIVEIALNYPYRRAKNGQLFAWNRGSRRGRLS